MLDKFPMDQIGANTLKRTTKYDYNMQADTVKTAINVNSQNLNANKCPI